MELKELIDSLAKFDEMESEVPVALGALLNDDNENK